MFVICVSRLKSCVVFLPFLSGESRRVACTVVGDQVFPALKFTQGGNEGLSPNTRAHT